MRSKRATVRRALPRLKCPRRGLEAAAFCEVRLALPAHPAPYRRHGHQVGRCGASPRFKSLEGHRLAHWNGWRHVNGGPRGITSNVY
jgi:hypothetical protein